MNLYDKYILPHLIDAACGLKPMHRQRAKLVPQARGKVLEIGIGTGLNLRHYDPAKLDELWGLDPALEMHGLAKRRMRKAGLTVNLLPLPAEEIPARDGQFDTIVCTYTLCTIPDPAQALREMYRVLAPDGQLLFCEHGRAPDAAVRRWQDRLNPVWKPIAGGCNLNRDVPELLAQAGFRTDAMDSMYLPGPKPLTFNVWGQARRG